MITAKEARERVDALETESGRREKEMAKRRINEAIERGEHYCLLGTYISNAMEHWLKSLGYEITNEGSSVKVTWW